MKGGGTQSLVQPGDVVDGYVVGKLFAKEGGMGLLYLVEDPGLPKLPLVMKVLPADSPPDMVARMEREAHALSMLSSARHVVRIHKTGRCPDGSPYIVLEKLAGEDLQKVLRRERRLGVARAVGIAVQAGMGLHACHAAGVLHRDVKPGNLFLHNEAELGEVVKIIDFGISHLGAGPAITSLNATSGTRRYMAPEQARGHDDERADQFSLAVVLFEMLAGELPWPMPSREDGGAHERLVASGRFKRLRALTPEVPEALEATVMRALSPVPDQRFSSVLEFARELLPFAGADVQAVFGRYAEKATPLAEPHGAVGGPEGSGSSAEMNTAGRLPAHRSQAPPESEYATVSNGNPRPARPSRRRLVVGLALIGATAAGVPAWLLFGQGGGIKPGAVGSVIDRRKAPTSDRTAISMPGAAPEGDARPQAEQRGDADASRAEPSLQPSPLPPPSSAAQPAHTRVGREARPPGPGGARKSRQRSVNPLRTPQGTAIVE